MILLFTDFGVTGPYVGQLEAVLRRLAPGIDVVHLQADAPAFRVEIALNRGNAAAALGLELGTPLALGRIDCQEPARQCT